MYPLGHLGLGVHLVPERLRKGLRFRWLALGCLLPDLIDKPYWLAMEAIRWQPRGSRLVGHTLLFCGALALAARLLRSPVLRAVSLGALTHVALDVAGELAAGMQPIWTGWLFWPLFGWRFPIESNALPPAVPEVPIYLVAEAAGFLLLIVDFVRWRRARARALAR